MKLAIIGYGKMGHIIEEVAKSRGHEIVCIIDVNNPDDYNSDAFRSADVAIEFTNPKAAYNNYLKAFEQGVKVVSGSTGWRDEHQADVEALIAKGNTLFWASNFSLGVAIFSAAHRYLARIMNQFPTYDINISETHHTQKLDAPSGTAITLAEELLQEIDRKDKWELTEYHKADGTTEAHAASNDNILEMKSYREANVPGIHSISYSSEADTITLTHNAHNRRGFALGAVLAAEYTHTHEGLLTTSDLFNF